MGKLTLCGQLGTEMYKKNWYLSLIVTFSFLQILLTSAPLFGYSSLLVIFKRMNLYHQLCPNSTHTAIAADDDMYKSNELQICVDQEAALDLPFAFGAFLHNAVKVVIGNIIDRYGSRYCNLAGCMFLLVFGVLLASVHQGTEYLLYPAFVILAISSSFLMLCPYQIVNIMIKKNKAFYICILSGSVDSSTVVFYVFLKIFEEGIKLQFIAIGYVIICGIMILTSTLMLYPSREVLTAELQASEYCELKEKLSSFKSSDGKKSSVESLESCSHDEKKKTYNPLGRASLKKCLFSWFNMCVIYQASITMLVLWYFIANIDKYLGFITDPATVSEYVKTFGLIQFCGMAVGPVTGGIFILINRSAVGTRNIFYSKIKSLNIISLILFTTTTLFLIIQLLQKLHLSIFVFVLFFLCNGIMWCFLSTFYAYIFPPQHYCTLYGFAMVCCGLVSFTQYPLLVLEQKVFRGDMFNIDVIFLIVHTSTVILPIYMLVCFINRTKD